MFKKKYPFEERRKYIRMDSVFPVEFQILGEGAATASDWQQGFTSNISAGGICLTINNPDEETIKVISSGPARLTLQINIPLKIPPVNAVASVAWIAKTRGSLPSQYAVGLKYESIAKKDLNRIMATARWLRNSLRLALGIILLLFIFVAGAATHNLKLRIENRRLVENLINVLQKEAAAKEELRVLGSSRKKLEEELIDNQNKTLRLESRLKEIEKIPAAAALQAQEIEIAQLKQALANLSQGKTALRGKLNTVSTRENIINEEIATLISKKSVLEEVTVTRMYRWLKVHQNPTTGLVLSFEGDDAVHDWAFIYDQSLAAQTFLLFNDVGSAKKILNFFYRQAKGNFNGFANAYYVSSGEVAEYALHSGPNIWVGIAILQYSVKTQDRQYLVLAEKIAAWLIAMQEQDPEGGIRGGPRNSWFSTEHNLDAYAFFNMLYQVTGNKKYAMARFKVLNWLKTHAYGRKEPPIKRGKGDSTIATDTYAWSIAALGPDKLKAIGMDPDEIIKFAEDNCLVAVNFARPNHEVVKVKGFDFAKTAHIARGGVVSSEWSAQMVMAFKIMADFYWQKNDSSRAEAYQHKANYYLNELSKMIISSPSPTGQGDGCLPYATSPYADTGHGWRTPHGNRTGSIAGTAYTIFAQENYNPLALEKLKGNEE